MDVQKVLATLNLRDCDVLNIYLHGSRLHSPDKVTPQSDYDVIIIIKDGKDVAPVSFVHKANIDALILTKDTFVSRIKDGYILESMCKDIPLTHVWLQRELISAPINKKRLLENLTRTLKKDEARRKKFEQAAQFTLVNKITEHSMRHASWVNQLVTQGCIRQFH